jgi:hypothetical protein
LSTSNECQVPRFLTIKQPKEVVVSKNEEDDEQTYKTFSKNNFEDFHPSLIFSRAA